MFNINTDLEVTILGDGIKSDINNDGHQCAIEMRGKKIIDKSNKKADKWKKFLRQRIMIEEK